MRFSIRSKVVRRRAGAMLILVALAFMVPWTRAGEDAVAIKVGTHGSIGCDSNAKRVKRLVIDKPGVYENYLVDGE